MFLKKALVLAAEIPNINMFGGVCFQRLYSATLGTLLSVVTGKDHYVDEGCIFSGDKQLSVVILNRVKESVLFHILIPLETEHEGLQALEVDDKKLKEIQENAIASFHHLLSSTYIESQRDNF